MSKLRLPSGGAVTRTPYLKAFENELIELNRFYWVFRCSTWLMSGTAKGHARIRDFIDPGLAANVDVTSSQFSLLVPGVEQTARYAIIVQAVTYFEAYLASILEQTLIRGWSATKTYTIRFRPNELPNTKVEDFIQLRAVKTEVDSIVAAKYTERGARIAKLLNENGYPSPQAPQLQNPKVTEACELRNCIVHASAKADSRAVASLSGLFPGLKIGDRLPLTETQTWSLVSAIRDDARAIDFSLRRKAEDRAKLQRQQKRRKKAARHSHSLAMQAKYRGKLR